MRKFRQFTISGFEGYISTVPVKREINHIQIHHTWKPRKADYRGEATILGMWQYHTQTNGWQDIAQHFSIAPDGTIWDGRDLNLDPAGIKGYNRGGLMIEIIGDFDEGQDRLDNSQLFAVASAVIACQDRFRLKNADIVFHREIDPSKSCPGTGIDRYLFLNAIDKTREVKGGKEVFADVPSDHWGVNAIRWASDQGLLTANQEGRFRPNDLVTRAEMAAILHRMVGKGMLK